MRGKLVLLIAALAAAGFVVSWKIGPRWRNSIGGSAGSPELQAVSRRPDLSLPAEIRVNVTGNPVARIQIAIDGPYTVRLAGSASTRSRSDTGPIAIIPLANGFRLGKKEFVCESLEIEAVRSPAIWVEDHQYRGRVRFVRPSAGKLIAINIVPLEDYIASVVDGEMPATFPEAARQAQAIAARTYVLFQMQSPGAKASPLYDVYATTRSQSYPGYQYRGRDGRRYAAETASGRRIVKQTAGMVCLCEGKPFCTYYTAVCGGGTTSGNAVFDDPTPALQAVPCEWCKDAQLYQWRREVPLASASEIFKRYFVSHGKRFGSVTSIRRTVSTDYVREPSFELNDGKRSYQLSTMEVRRLLPQGWISSFRFDVHVSGGDLLIEGRGHGHGVGLCQWGARGMALAGLGPLEILRHYYPGADVVSTH